MIHDQTWIIEYSKWVDPQRMNHQLKLDLNEIQRILGFKCEVTQPKS